jgi:hypothetical protein
MYMGYTCGRKHTEESLRDIAKLYNTKSEFQKKDPGAYISARNKGNNFLNSICEHMINGAYSTPQLICKKIMEELLGIKCLYNTRKIITPYELDIYFPEFKLAIEYNGKGWHSEEEVISRDKIKKQLCDNNDIVLLVINERNRDYEEDVKSQLILNLDLINNLTRHNFTESDINNVDCENVYDSILKRKDIKEIQDKISKCSSIKEFQRKYISEYNFLRRKKKLDLLNEIRTVEMYSDEELLNRCKKISNYTDFIENHVGLYSRCKNRNLIGVATAHMKKRKNIYKYHSNEELMVLAKTYNFKSQMKTDNNSLFNELKSRKILNDVVYNPDFVYIHSKTIEKENKLKQCFVNASKYGNYEDFKNDKELYDQCVRFKIVKKITDNFSKPNIYQIILEESKKYKNFKEFSKTEWYRKTKGIAGLIQKVKKENNWKFFANKEELNYVKDYPEVVEMINSGVTAAEISKIMRIGNSKIYKIKKEMYEKGILKVAFNTRKKINN